MSVRSVGDEYKIKIDARSDFYDFVTLSYQLDIVMR